MEFSILDLFDLLDVLHLLHLFSLLSEAVSGLSHTQRRNSDEATEKYVFVAAAAGVLETVGHAAWLLEDADARSVHISGAALLPSFVGVEWVVIALGVMALRAESLWELVAACLSLFLTAAMVASSVLFLSGEGAHTLAAVALLACCIVAVIAGILSQTAAPDELTVMYGALGATSMMLWGAALLLGSEQYADDEDVDAVALVVGVCLAAAATAVSTLTTPEKRVVSQFSLASVAGMVGWSSCLLSGEEVREEDGIGWGWSIAASAALLAVSTKKHETLPVLSCATIFLSCVSWSVRMMASQGEVAAFVDAPMWTATCWVLPMMGIAAAILQPVSSLRQRFVVSGAMAAVAAIVWSALHLVAPDDVPGFVSPVKRQRVDAVCEKRYAFVPEKIPLKDDFQSIKSAKTMDDTVDTAEAAKIQPATTQHSNDEDGTYEEVVVAEQKWDRSPDVALLQDVIPSLEEIESQAHQKDIAEDLLGPGVEPLQVVAEESNDSAIGPGQDTSKTHQAPEEGSEFPADAVSEAAESQSATEETSDSPNQHARQYEKGPVGQDDVQSRNYLLSPGIWAILTLLFTIGRSIVRNPSGSAGATPFALAAGAAFFLTTYMFECAFAHLAPDDAGPSMCSNPRLLWFAASVMMGSILLVPASFTPNASAYFGSSKYAACICFGVVFTASMAGCALHQIAPEDVGKLACGPLWLLSSHGAATATSRPSAISAHGIARNASMHARVSDAVMAKAAQAAARLEEERRAAREMQAAAQAAAVAAQTEAAQAAARLQEERRAKEAAQEVQAAAQAAKKVGGEKRLEGADVPGKEIGAAATQVLGNGHAVPAATANMVEEVRSEAGQSSDVRTGEATDRSEPEPEQAAADVSAARVQGATEAKPDDASVEFSVPTVSENCVHANLPGNAFASLPAYGCRTLQRWISHKGPNQRCCCCRISSSS